MLHDEILPRQKNEPNVDRHQAQEITWNASPQRSVAAAMT
jgi:hypothetical protein